jgi:predicted nicotinamide N-methyase
METWKDVKIGDLIIHAREITDKEYGYFIWPCALEMASYVSKIVSNLTIPSNILEIGCGTALPGMYLAKLGHRLLFSDVKDAKLIENIEIQAKKNKITNCEFIDLDWRQIPLEFIKKIEDLPSLELILASDVLYDSKLTTTFFSIISLILHYHPKAILLLAYQERVEKTFKQELIRWNLKCELVQRNGDVYIFELQSSRIINSED